MFKLDSPLMNFLNKLCDIMILNILVLVFSLPIFTIGAAVTAGYYMSFKMVKNEESYIVKGFWKAFKENFRQSTALWLIILAVCGVLFVDYRIVLYSGLSFDRWLRLGLISYINHCIGSIFCICDAGTFHEHGEAYIEEFIPDGTFPSAQCCFVCSILCSTRYTAVFYPADTAGHCITGNRTTYLSEIFPFPENLQEI